MHFALSLEDAASAFLLIGGSQQFREADTRLVVDHRSVHDLDSLGT